MNLLQMSISGGVLILAGILIRAAAINRLPKMTFVILWEIAMIRLLIPFSIPSGISVYSLFNRNDVMNIIEETPVETAVTFMQLQANIDAPEVTVQGQAYRAIGEAASPASFVSPWTVIWLAGMLLCAAFFVISYLRCRLEFSASLPVQNDFVQKWTEERRRGRPVSARQSDRISAPLTYGIFKPVILMPKNTDWTNTKQLTYVFSHEYIHIRRFDVIKKLICTLTLCVHWFNPFVWIMYLLFNRDVELACDETVVKRFGGTSRKDYSLMLISMEAAKSGLLPFCNSFSKNSIEERITAIMKTKKVTAGIIIISIAIIASGTALFVTSANKQKEYMVYAMEKVFIATKEDVSEAVQKNIETSVIDSPYLGVIESTVDRNQIPGEEMQSNFGYVGTEVVFSRSGIAVNMDGKWIQFYSEAADDIPAVVSSSEITADINGDGVNERVTVTDNRSRHRNFTRLYAEIDNGAISRTVSIEFEGYWSSYLAAGDLNEDGAADIVLVRTPTEDTYGGGAVNVLYPEDDAWVPYPSKFIKNPAVAAEQPENFREDNFDVSCLGAAIVEGPTGPRLRLILNEDINNDIVKYVDCSYQADGWYIESMEIIHDYYGKDKYLELLKNNTYEDSGVNTEEVPPSDAPQTLLPAETPDNHTLANTVTLTFFKEGITEQAQASLSMGHGYAVYLPEEEWQSGEPDAWTAARSEKVRLWVTPFAEKTTEQVKELLSGTGYQESDSYEMYRQEEDMIYHVRLYEFEKDVWGVFYCYPAEAIEGWGMELPVIADTFTLLPDVVELERIASEFAAAYFSGDTDALQGYLTEPYEWDIDVYTGLNATGAGTPGDFTLRGLIPVSNAETGSTQVLSLEFRDSNYDDMFLYLTMKFVKQEGGWKIQFYGLEG